MATDTPKLPPLADLRDAAESPSTLWAFNPRDLARWALAVREAARPLSERCLNDGFRKPPCTCAACRLARLIGGDDE